ncbi:MAG: hypothetical protein AAGL98_09895 [Planctomycetota bacterium]
MADETPNLKDADVVVGLLRDAAAQFRQSPLRKGATVHLPDHGRLLATGDLHDHGLNFQRIVKLADLAKNEDRHVILHEVIHGPDRVNGADLSVRMLARCADLALKFPGQVHVMQSNHELAQMRDEGITKDGVSVVDAFNAGIDFLYGGAADEVRDAVNDYIGALCLAVRCANGVMVSHSLPAPRRIEAFDKGVLDREPTPGDWAPKGSAYDMVWGRYQNRVILAELAAAWGVSVFVIGHQPVEMGYEELGDNAVIIGSDDGHGVGLPIDLSRTYTRDELVKTIRPLASVTV